MAGLIPEKGSDFVENLFNSHDMVETFTKMRVSSNGRTAQRENQEIMTIRTAKKPENK